MEPSNPKPEFPTATAITGEKFKLGRLVIDEHVEAQLIKSLGSESAYRMQLGHCVSRHSKCDWGDVPSELREINEQIVANEGTPKGAFALSSFYILGDAKVVIVTKADRSDTTVLIANPHELAGKIYEA
jgi:hypothetical protein